MGTKTKAPPPPPARRSPVLAIVAVIVFAAIAIGFFVRMGQSGAANSGAPSPPASAAAASSAPSPAGPAFSGAAYPSQGHAHLNPDEPDDFVYNSNPPTSGPHKEIFSDQFVNPNPLPVYVQVHLLEHGNVLLQYNCACPEVAASLSSIAYQYDSALIAPNELQPAPAEVQAGEEQGKAVIVAPYPQMKSRIALTAWTRLATLSAVDKQKIQSFIGLYLSNTANASQ